MERIAIVSGGFASSKPSEPSARLIGSLNLIAFSHCPSAVFSSCICISGYKKRKIYSKEGQLEVTTEDGIAIIPIEDLSNIK